VEEVYSKDSAFVQKEALTVRKYLGTLKKVSSAGGPKLSAGVLGAKVKGTTNLTPYSQGKVLRDTKKTLKGSPRERAVPG